MHNLNTWFMVFWHGLGVKCQRFGLVIALWDEDNDFAKTFLRRPTCFMLRWKINPLIELGSPYKETSFVSGFFALSLG